MHTVASRDGTPIACWTAGNGPPLLLVHGAIADHTTTWRFVGPALEQHFTVHLIDRRGRGKSGDGASYELRREAEDIAAVVDAIGGPVSVLGHSFGALCALEAALLTRNIATLVLYEGVPVRGTDFFRPDLIDRLEAILGEGDRETMLLTLFRELLEMPEEEIARLRSQPEAWTVRLSNAPTVPRELREEQRYVFDAARFRHMEATAIFLVGSESQPHELRNATAIAGALKHGRVSLLPGQRHLAMYTGPDQFVQTVISALRPPAA